MLERLLIDFLEKRLAKKKHEVMRLEWERAALEDLIRRRQRDELTPRQFATEYNNLISYWEQE